MSDLISRTDGLADDDLAGDHPAPTSASVEIRRRTVLCGAVAGGATAVAVAYLLRAAGGGSWVDWVVGGVAAALATLHLAAMLDGRAPLLVADTHGVRLRSGRRWNGVAWDDLDCLEHLPRRAPLRDGHVLVIDRAGEQTPVPLSLATRLVGSDDGRLADTLAALADGRCDVVEVDPRADDSRPGGTVGDDLSRSSGTAFSWTPAGGVQPPEDETELLEQRTADAEWAGADDLDDGSDADEADSADVTDVIDVTVEPEAEEPEEPEEPEARDPHDAPEARPWADAATDLQPTSPPSPVRAPVAAARNETLASRIFSSVIGANALRRDPTTSADVEHTDPLPELDELRRPAEPDDEEVRVLADGGAWDDRADADADADVDQVEPLQPAAPVDPVIGPVLATARGRLGLGVDQLAERTRIRPHVIEAIEVDDFGPCGGDFYARGHLRTLARVLGVDAGRLLATYDEVYADAPIDPRRVFEADLASGSGGALRSTRGGPNWTVLVAAVMGVVLIWSVARLLMDGPAPTPDTPVLNQSGGLHNNARGGAAVPITFTAAGGGATVQVTDAKGEVVFDGELAFGQTADVQAVPPVRVTASDGSVTASIDGAPADALGATGEEASKTLVAP